MNFEYTENKKLAAETRIRLCFQLLEKFRWLVDSYVLDFFTEGHWEKLPPSWQEFLSNVDADNLGCWLLGHTPTLKTVCPLSLLCLLESSKCLSLPRQAIGGTDYIINFLEHSGVKIFEQPFKFGNSANELSCAAGQHHDLGHVFRKHVKPKKQHEIVRLAKTCSLLATVTGCGAAVDVGAGVGHLSRFLHYGHHLQMFCLDAESNLTNAADKFDQELEKFYAKKSLPHPVKPKHVTLRLTPNIEAETFMNILDAAADQREDSSLFHGVVGLHTCGDLAPTLVKLFAKVETMSFLVSVGCCYMKINQTGCKNYRCYPMSKFVAALPNSGLSYEALEIGCHAFETYCDRLTNSDDVDKLKVHCYRAVLETYLAQLDPPVKRAGLRSVKNAHLLTFKNYARKALDRLDIPINVEDIDFENQETRQKLDNWKKVVIFYSLRLVLAPIIETAVLLDRLIYLLEKGFNATLVPLFDPRLSPRNLALIAVKEQCK